MKEKEYCITQSMHETSQQIFSNNDKAIDKLLQMIPIEKKEEAMKLIKQFKSSEETESMQLIEYLIDEIEKNNLNISGKLDLQTELQQLQKERELDVIQFNEILNKRNEIISLLQE